MIPALSASRRTSCLDRTTSAIPSYPPSCGAIATPHAASFGDLIFIQHSAAYQPRLRYCHLLSCSRHTAYFLVAGNEMTRQTQSVPPCKHATNKPVE
uniref:Uncharacterized protein n=1 Tax=Aegilops tauschii subsp. strangulata TaxID=200361 RepID=A0A453SBH4_AEGTS